MIKQYLSISIKDHKYSFHMLINYYTLIPAQLQIEVKVTFDSRAAVNFITSDLLVYCLYKHLAIVDSKIVSWILL